MSRMRLLVASVSALLLAGAPIVTWAADQNTSLRCTSPSELLNNSIKVEEVKRLFAPTFQNFTSATTVKELKVTGDQLNEFDTSLTTYQVNKNGSLEILTNTASASGTDYLTIYSFKQYRTDGEKKYGISIQMNIRYTSDSGAISLAHLFGFLSANASASKFNGQVSLSVHGLYNPKVAALLPLPSKLDDTAAAQYFSYMGALKGLITDQETTVDPVWLSQCI
ncbi:hypothetical protein ACI2VK_24220 [Ralstonia nicotianae]|uniref:hypothetical protein n=1 Tax=Ralstonia pseudosolanacearum TaxID=1310165 RepID=UPI001F46F31E|nr:hypothetical protein [Ralstonia pseudosolanacearum]MCF1444407.1 hypothetical protein [Ralstonia solanacearum]MDO3507058.1 hypothetical protein [Ralstonia pseudosolanacearum]